MKKDNRMTIIKDRVEDISRSPFQSYKQLFVGSSRFFDFLKYELVLTFFSWLPGAVGLFLRRLFYPCIFGKIGKGVVFGRNITIRHPAKIFIGSGAIIDDNAVLDAKGENSYIKIGNNVIITKNVILGCKGGFIEIGDNTTVAMNSIFQSESSLIVGENVIIAAFCHLVAGGNHDFSRLDLPIIQQPSLTKGGIVVEKNCWLASNVVVLDGVTVGRDSIIGAGSVVTKNIPQFSVAYGIPAKVVENRKEAKSRKRPDRL